MPTRSPVMQGKSVSPLARTRKPQFSTWYHIVHSALRDVFIVLMKSTAETGLPSGPGTSCAASTMNSLAPMPS